MILQRIWKIGFGLAAVILSAATVFLSFSQLNASPIVLKGSQEALAAVQAMLDDVQTGDAQKISSHFIPGTDLSEYYQLDNAAARRLIHFVWENLESEILTDAYADTGALAVDVKITAPNAVTLTGQMQKLTAPLLNTAVDEAKDVSAIIDENNQYRESFLESVLLEAVDAAASFTTPKTQNVTVHVQCRDGLWEIVPEDALINALSGWAK